MRYFVSLSLIVVATIVGAGTGCAHAQRLENRIHVVSEDTSGVGTALGSGGAGGHDCQEEHDECMKLCWKKRYPWPHNEEQAGWYYKRCTSDCRAQYSECVEEQEEAERKRAKKLDFSRMDQAISWLREHKTEVALGTIVVVGGVTFVLMTGGSGALILAPLAL